MSLVQIGLLAALLLVGVGFAVLWRRSLRTQMPPPARIRPSGPELIIGFVTNFFDTLGVGSFAPTTAAYRVLHIVPDELIPGTLNVRHSPPTLLEAAIFIVAIYLDPWRLVAMLAAAVVGAWA